MAEVVKLSPTCIGPHSQVPNFAGPMWVRAGCRVILATNQMGVLNEALDINPNILVIGRYDDPRVTAEELRDRGMSPLDAALHWVNVYKTKWQLNPRIKRIALVNEPVFKRPMRDAQGNILRHPDGSERHEDDPDGLRWLNEFCVHCIQIMASMGLQAVGPNFSTGYPAIESWPLMLGTCRALRDNDGFLGIHGYSHPGPMHEDQHNANRHELIYKEFLKPNGLANLTICYTEIGRIEFLKFAPGGDEREREEAYARELIQEDERLMAFEGEVLAVVFTAGSDNVEWDHYDYSRTNSRVPAIVADHMRVLADRPPPPPPPPTPPPPGTIFTEGIDVSHHQSVIDWAQVAASGISYAFIRVSDGVNTPDRFFTRNWNGAKEHGIIRGAYQYFRPAQDARRQADILLDAIMPFQRGDIVPALDIETLDGVTIADLQFKVATWVNHVRDALGGVPIILYGRKNQFDPWGLSIFNDNDLWVANYEVVRPAIPRGWDTFRFWQYEVDQIEDGIDIPGINADIDRNRFNGTLAQLREYVGTQLPVPVPPPSTRFKPGDIVFIAVGGLNVRSDPTNGIAGTPIGSHTLGDKAIVTAPSILATLDGVQIIMWHLNFDSGVDGWCSGGRVGNERYLEKFVPAPEPPPPPPPTPTEERIFVEDWTHGHYLQNAQEDNKWTANGWVAWFARASDARIDGQDETQTWTPPEVLIDAENRVHISERDQYFKRPDGTRAIHLLHLFRGWGRIWYKTWRTHNLEAGTYRLRVRYWPDVVIRQRIIGDVLVKEECDPNPLNNEFNWIIGHSNTQWILGDKHPSCQYSTVETVFTHTGGPIDLGMQFRFRWGVLVTGAYVDTFEVFRVRN